MPLLRFPHVRCVFVLFINLLNLLPEDIRGALASIIDTVHNRCIIIIEKALGIVTVYTNTAFSSIACTFDKIEETVSAAFSNLDSADLNIIYKKDDHSFLLIRSYLCRKIKDIILSKFKYCRKTFDVFDWDFPNRALRRSRNEDVQELLKNVRKEGYLTESDLDSFVVGQQDGEFVKECCYNNISLRNENERYFDSEPEKIKRKREKHKKDKSAVVPLFRTFYFFPLVSKTDMESSSSGNEVKFSTEQNTKHPLFSQYTARLVTFCKSNFLTNSEHYARLGFFSLGFGDSVCCYKCGVVISQWKNDADPLLEHVRYSPECRHLASLMDEKTLLSFRELLTQTSPDSIEIGKGARRGEGIHFHGQIRHQNSTSQRDPLLKCIETRLSTFGKFPNDNGISIMDFAKAGFYYTGIKDIVRCFWCDVCLLKWAYGDDPYWEHAKYQPSCNFLRHVKGQGFIAYVQEKEKQNQRGELQRRRVNNSSHGAPRVGQEKHTSQWDNKKIRSPEYSSIIVRLSTFARFPVIPGVNVRIIADAGFYYTGKEDIVRCYACDGGLKKWMPGDDPWEEHYKWYPDCPHLRQFNHRPSKREASVEIREEKTKETPTTSTERSSSSESLARRMNKMTTGEGLSDLGHMIEEDERLTSKLMCKCCKERQRNILVLPCAHVCLCHQCSMKISLCPECWKPIREKIRTYMP